MKNLDIAENRKQKKYTSKEYLLRILWQLGSLIFRLSPRNCFRLRRVILRAFGAKVGKAVNIYSSASIFAPWNLEIEDYSCIGSNVQVYNLGYLKVGENSTISQNSHLCGGTHNYKDASMPLIKSRILIGNNVWVCADSFIGPGVNIADSSIVAARSVVIKDVGVSHIVGGNPAKFIKMRD